MATDHTRILVDAGLSVRELGRRLEAAGESIDRIDAVLITHEHSDHVAGLARLVRYHKRLCRKLPVFLTRLTAPSVEWGEAEPQLEEFQAGTRFSIGEIEITSFSIPHDAKDPVGFTMECGGVKVGIVTDLGYVPESVKFHLRGTDLLLLESNHDLDMLKVGPYPWVVKQRVMSRVGHLSNLAASEFLDGDFDGAPAHLILGHLSEQNNHPEIARMTAAGALARRGLKARLAVASQHEPSEVFSF